MKKTGQPAPPVPEPVSAPVEPVEPVKEIPQSGFGRFEYINGTLY